MKVSYTGFRSESLSRREEGTGTADSRQRDWLAGTVNRAARPYPAAQWFQRRPDGGGEGRSGLRLEPTWQQRALPAQAFPELLLRASWNNLLEQSVIKAYHTWLAPLLLLLPDLSETTRDWLEASACRRPAWLARVHRLIPRVLDSARLNAALVAARLEVAAGTADPSSFDY